MIGPASIRAHRRCLVGAVLAAALGAAVVPVSSTAAAPRPMTILVDSFAHTPFGSSFGVYSGAKAAARSINKDKRLNVKIVTCNSKATVAGTQICARRAIDVGASALVGIDPFLAGGSIGVAQLTAARIPFSLFSSSAESFKRAGEFPLTGGGFTPYLGFGIVAKRIGGKKLGTICTEFPGSAEVCENIKRIAEKHGVQVVARPTISLSSTTFGAQVQQLKAAGADTVAIATPGVFSAPIAAAAKAIGYSPRWMVARAPFADSSGFATFARAAGPRTWAISALPPIEAAKSYPGLRQYQRESRGIVKTANQDEASISTWAAVHGYAMVAASVKGDITAAKLSAALKRNKDIRIPGGLLTWSPAKRHAPPYTRLANDLVYYGQVRGGIYIPNPKKPIRVAQGVALR